MIWAGAYAQVCFSTCFFYRDFPTNGVCRTARWTTADFLTSVSDPHERQVRAGFEDRIPRSAEQFAAAYRNSQSYETNIKDVERLEQEAEQQRQTRLAASTKATKERNYTLSFQKQVWACTHRQFLVMFGDHLSLYGKWGTASLASFL